MRMRMRPQYSESSSSTSNTSSSSPPSSGVMREISPIIATVENNLVNRSASGAFAHSTNNNVDTLSNHITTTTTNLPDMVQLPQSNHTIRTMSSSLSSSPSSVATATEKSKNVLLSDKKDERHNETQNMKIEAAEQKTNNNDYNAHNDINNNNNNNKKHFMQDEKLSSVESNTSDNERAESENQEVVNATTFTNATTTTTTTNNNNNKNKVGNNNNDDNDDDDRCNEEIKDSLAELSREQLIDKCNMYEEWNDRLQGQLAELMSLSQNIGDNDKQTNNEQNVKRLAALKAKMYKSEIALPLLQCYDAAIAVEAENNAVLTGKVEYLERECNTIKREKKELQRALELAEQLTQQVEKHSLTEIDKLEKSLREAHDQIGQLQMELKHALERVNHNKSKDNTLGNEQAKAQETIVQLQSGKQLLERELQLCKGNIQHYTNQATESTNELMQQRVQLQLVRKENESLQKEMHDVRERMIKALQESTNNHNKHFELVQTKHKAIIDQYKAANRTRELELVKLRTQLSRYDLQASANNGVNSLTRTFCKSVGSTATAATTATTTTTSSSTANNAMHNLTQLSGQVYGHEHERTIELLATHAREQVEAQIKQLYKQLCNLQREKQEIEENNLTALAKVQQEMKIQATQHNDEMTKATSEIKDLKVKHNKLLNEQMHLKEDLSNATEKLKACQVQLSEAKRVNFELQSKLEHQTQQLNEMINKLALTNAESERVNELEKAKNKELEERVCAIVDTEIEQVKRNAEKDICHVRREQELLTEQVRTLESEVKDKNAQLASLQRSKSSLERQLQHILDTTIPNHETTSQELNRQLTSSNEKLRVALAQVQTLTLDKEQLQWELERHVKRHGIARKSVNDCTHYR